MPLFYTLTFMFLLAFPGHIFAEESGENKDMGILKLGIVLPLSGNQSIYGKEAQSAIEIAKENFALKNPELKDKIQIYVRDDKGLPSESLKACNDLVKIDRVNFLIGSLSTTTSESVAKSAVEMEKTMISPISSRLGLTQMGENIFSTANNPLQQGVLQSNFAYNRLKLKSGLIISSENKLNSTEIADIFAKNFTSLGGKITETIDSQKLSNAKIKSSQNPIEFIFISELDTNDLFNVIKKIHKTNPNLPILGVEQWKKKEFQQFITAEKLNYFFFPSSYTTMNAEDYTKEFIEKFKRKEGRLPSVLAVFAHDGFMAAAEAYKNAKSIREKPLTRNLQNANSIQGVMGPFYINENKDPIKTYGIMTIENGKIKLFEKVFAEKASPIQKG